jgi:sarcosine oxidase subunit alpha
MGNIDGVTRPRLGAQAGQMTQKYRLPAQPGEWINRGQKIPFQFEGRPFEGFSGDTLNTALWANGVRVLGRSFKYQRPRGIFSLAGTDSNVLLDDGTQTNLRGDCTPIYPEMMVCAVNTFGGRWPTSLVPGVL